MSLVPLSAAVVSDLDVEPSSCAGAPYTAVLARLNSFVRFVLVIKRVKPFV